MLRRRILTFFWAGLLLTGSNASASLPSVYPEDNWEAVSRILASKRLSKSWRDVHGHTRVYFEMRYGSEEKAAYFIKESGRRKVWMEGGTRLLTYAATIGSQRITAALLANGDNPNSIRANESSPLSVAAAGGHLEVMRLLLSKGADPNYISSTGVDALSLALSNGQDFAARLLVDNGLDIKRYLNAPDHREIVFKAIAGGKATVMTFISEYPFNLDRKNGEGETPLTFAIKNGSPREIVEVLLLHGADECQCNSAGMRPVEVISTLQRIDHQISESYINLFQRKCQN